MGLTTTFVGIDDDAFGDGDEATLFLDAWLQRRLQYNLEHCLEGYHSVNIAPYINSGDDYTSLAGIRPYCATEWHTVWAGWLPVSAGQNGYAFTLVYHSTVPGSTSTAGTINVRLRFGRDESKETLATTYSGGEETGHQTVSCQFSETIIRDGVRFCEIAVQSELTTNFGVATTVGPNADGTSALVHYYRPHHVKETTAAASNGLFAYNSSGTAPDLDSRECMHLYAPATALIEQNPSYNRFLDLLWTEELTTGGNRAGVLGANMPLQHTPTTAATGELWANQCFLLRGIWVRPFFGSETTIYQGVATLNPRKFAPNVTLNATECGQQMNLVRRAYFQPYLVSAGPRGRKVSASGATRTDMDALDFYGYAAHWPFVVGDYDGATTGEETILIDEAVYLRTENPTLTLRAIWIAAHIGGVFGTYTQLADDEGSKGAIRQAHQQGWKVLKPITEEYEGTGTALWDLTFSVGQLANVSSGVADWGGDSTDFGTKTETLRSPVNGTTGDHAPPVLRGIDAMANLSKGSGNAPGFWFKEGSLFDEDITAGVAFETEHALTLSGMTSAETVKPVRLYLDVSLDSYSAPQKPESSPTTKLRLYLVGYSVVEEPQEP